MVGKDQDANVRKGRSGGLKAEKPAKSTEKRSSPARSRVKSPSRPVKAPGTRSPGRPRRIPDSPVETPQSPTKKTSPKSPKQKTSPKATVKTTASSKSAPPKPPSSPGRRPIRSVTAPKPKEPAVAKRLQIIQVDESESDSDTPTTSSVQTRSRRTMSKEASVELVNNLRSRVRRDNADLFKSRSNYEPVKKLTEFSDEDETEQAPRAQTRSKLHIGAIIGALLYCLGELAITYLIPLLCDDTRCEYRLLSRKDLTTIIGSFDLSVFFGFTSFVLFNGIFSVIPLGGKKYASMVSRDGKFEYILNALFALIVQVIILVTLEVYHIPVTAHIINNYFSLITSAVVLSFTLGVILFIKSLYTSKDNLVSEEQGHLTNFILGAEVNPRFGPMDVKFVVTRVCTVGLILLVLSYVYQSMEMISTPPLDAKSTNVTWNLLQSFRIRPTLFVLSTLIIIYFADQFVFESGLLSYMEFKTVSWGFLKCNEYLAGLFVYGAVPKYVYDYHVELENWELLLCTIMFLAGYIMYRGANSQKHAFRENPYAPLVSRYDSIPSTIGKKILCSGYWGFVRHPNYLGDIMLNAALIRFVWPTPLLLIFVFIIGHLAVRAYVDNKKCRQRYGVAWDRYCQRVPYLLIPKVF